MRGWELFPPHLPTGVGIATPAHPVPIWEEGRQATCIEPLGAQLNFTCSEPSL